MSVRMRVRVPKRLARLADSARIGIVKLHSEKGCGYDQPKGESLDSMVWVELTGGSVEIFRYMCLHRPAAQVIRAALWYLDSLEHAARHSLDLGSDSFEKGRGD